MKKRKRVSSLALVTFTRNDEAYVKDWDTFRSLKRAKQVAHTKRLLPNHWNVHVVKYFGIPLWRVTGRS